MINNSTFEDKEYENILKNEIKENKNEIFSSRYKEKKVWVKKARATSSLKSHRIYYKIFPIEILLEVEKKNARQTILHETNKLNKFRTLGINTPKVLGRNEDFFVLEDCGKNINSYIRKRDITKEQMYYFINKLISHLANIHNCGEFHGGAQARNFTYKNARIFSIDLEESFNENIDLKILQFRDFVLFLLSLTKTRASFELDFKYIIYKYINLSNNHGFINKLQLMSKKMFFLTSLSEVNFINKFLGRDVKIFFKLFKILKDLK